MKTKEPKKVRDLLKTKANWTQNAWARDKRGCAVGSLSPDAVSFCLLGALSRCYSGRESGYYAAYMKLCRILGDKPVQTYNDAPRRKFSQIRKLIVKAGI